MDMHNKADMDEIFVAREGTYTNRIIVESRTDEAYRAGFEGIDTWVPIYRTNHGPVMMFISARNSMEAAVALSISLLPQRIRKITAYSFTN